MADQLGAVVNESDATVLNLAAEADENTLSKLARAIRRYSTTRAREHWDECTIPLEKLLAPDGATRNATLCLRCQSVEIGAEAAQRHRPPACIVLNLATSCTATMSSSEREAATADSARVQIEEFRRLRAAFGLSHFGLDCYVRQSSITFTWRPVS